MFDVKIGYEDVGGIFCPLHVNLLQSCHWLVTGGSNSGKTVFLSYALKSVLDMPIGLWVADFKGSGSFNGLTSNYAEFGACEGLLRAFYEKYQQIKNNKTRERILMLFDELPGFLIFLSQNKKASTEIKNIIAEILMMGRELPGGGSAWFWCSCQRADAEYFSHGSRLNYMFVVGLGRLNRESKGMLFPGEDIPEDYMPRTGRGLILEDGKPLRVLQVPELDKDKLKRVLVKKAMQSERQRAEHGVT